MNGRLTGLAAAGLVSAWLGTAQAQTTEASTYSGLVARLKASENDLRISIAPSDFRSIRYAYADSPAYDPFGTLTELSRVEMVQAYQHHEDDVALDQANRVLDQNYADIGAHVVAALAYEDLKRMDAAGFHRRLAREFLLTIFRSGDGVSPASAYQIVSVPEEYAVLNARQLVFQTQTYITVDGHRYDKLVCADPMHGDRVTVYFNVDRLMRWADQMFSPEFRHLPPHGGAPDSALAAANAMLSAAKTGPSP